MIARAAAAVLALLLGACAALPGPQPLPDLAGIPDAFEMSGRLAMRQGDRSDIAKLRWTHQPGRDLWVISSPLGNEVARIEADSSGATLTQAGGAGARADSFAELTERALGIALDPATLARWLHGGAPSASSDWVVTVEEKQRAGAIEIARRIGARRGDVVVRLVVDEYKALPD